MTGLSVTYSIAFLAGLTSFFSPCVLPLVPAYIGYLGGRSAANAQDDDRTNHKISTFVHGIAFVIGFSLVFVFLGTTLSFLGWLLHQIQYWLVKIGGIIVIIFGLHLTGLYRIKFLDYDLRPKSTNEERRSLFSSMLMGVFFSAGWSPCVGPVLGTILTLAMASGTVIKGAILLSVYSLGLALPFLLTALGIGWMIVFMKRFKKVLLYTEIITGWALIVIGVLLFFNIYSKISIIGSIG